MQNTETQEMYLVTIDKLVKQKGDVRGIDVAVERGFSKSTVHVGLKHLAEQGLINFTPGKITLTAAGLEKAHAIEEKHELIVKALVLLGATDEVAERNACMMEHAMTDEVYDLLRKHVAHGEKLFNAMNRKRMEKMSELGEAGADIPPFHEDMLVDTDI